MQISDINNRFYHPVRNNDLTDALCNPGLLADTPNGFDDIFDPATQGILIHLEPHQRHVAGMESLAGVLTCIGGVVFAIVAIVKCRAQS